MSPLTQTPARRGACLGIIAAWLLSACAVGPDFVRPVPPAEDRYTSESQAAATLGADGQAQRFKSDVALAADWWKLFKSEQLDAMVKQAIANNPTLEASEATLRQSQNGLRAGYGVFFPQINAGLAGSRERNAPLVDGLQTPGTIFNLVTLSGSIGYTFDVFGGERRMVEGLRAQTDYQRNANIAAYLALSANVVNTGIARAAYAAQIRATEQLIAMENEQLAATQAQVDAGTAGYASVLSMRSQIAANQAALALLKQKIDQAGHLLATLEGVSPGKASLPDIELSKLALPTDLPVSLPSDLVRQRPDILQAEAQLHVASANVGVATAAMYPSFSLTGTYGAAGTSLGNLSAENGRFWSIGPSISIPLFRGGSLWYGRQAAIDAYQASQATYRQTVLAAFAQVADSLKALEHDAEALQAQADAQHAAEEALHLLQANYRAGLAAYLDVLTVDVQYQQATIAYLQAVAQRHQDTVALFVALGGGWWNGKNQTAEGKSP
jgi:NodT family efflux transporter outer membrane factor (OMF) lipoprotein